MNLSKLGMVALSASAIFMATSCNKAQSLSYDKALEWVKNHYTAEGEPTVTGGKEVIDFSKTTGEEAKAAVKSLFSQHGITLDDSLKKTIEYSADECVTYYLTADNFVSYFVKELGYKFSVLNNALSVTLITVPPEGSGGSGEITNTLKYNKKGALVSEFMKYDHTKQEGIDGIITGTEKTTYTFAD